MEIFKPASAGFLFDEGLLDTHGTKVHDDYVYI